MEKVLIFYSEIALKGKNKKVFENLLKKNITRKCKISKLNLQSIKWVNNSLFCEFEDEKEQITKALTKVFGIKYFAFVQDLKKDVDDILEKAKIAVDKYANSQTKEINIKIKRADKNFPLTSVDLSKKIGDYAISKGVNINFKNKENILFIRINFKNAYLYHEKIVGADGLPTGSAGRCLVLLSGGIDSPAAAYQIMKRGAICDFLHFHTFKDNKEVLDSKMSQIIRILNEYQTKATLYTIPHYIFFFHTMGKIYENYQLVYFKHYLLKIADELCKKYDYLAIVTGDALAQVASQTLANLNVASYGIDNPIFRPFIGSEKEQIIELARNIGTYDISIEKYGDCCSLTAQNPILNAKLDKLQKAKQFVDEEAMIKESFDNLEIFKIEDTN